MLRPYGGAAYLDLPAGAGAGVPPAGLNLPGAQFSSSVRAAVLRRVGPLPESARWTHEYADAASSYFSETYAFDGRSGQALWHEPIGGWPMMLCGEQFLTQQGQPFDVRTGKQLGPALNFTKGGCNYAVANPYLLLFRDQSASYIERVTGQKQDLYAVRSGCSNSLIAADGLLNVPNFAVGCVCNYPLQTSFALVPRAAQD